MELVTKKRFVLYSGRAHLALAEEIAEHLGVELGNPNVQDFANGEMRPRFGESVRGCDVFIMQTHAGTAEMSINDTIMEQLIMIDAAHRASAKRITAVCPFYGYARQDRKAEGREPITAKLVADMFKAAGAKRMISVDLHSGQIQGFFDGPVDHLMAAPVLLDYLHDNESDDLVIVSPDSGRIKVAERFAQHLDADLAFIYRRGRRAWRTSRWRARSSVTSRVGIASSSTTWSTPPPPWSRRPSASSSTAPRTSGRWRRTGSCPARRSTVSSMRPSAAWSSPTRCRCRPRSRSTRSRCSRS